MRSILATTVRERLADYLAGRVTLRSFRRWLESVLWDVERAGDPEAEQLCYGIELCLAEYDADHWSQEDFRLRLLELLGAVGQPENPNRPKGRSSSPTTVLKIAPSATAGTRFQSVPASAGSQSRL